MNDLLSGDDDDDIERGSGVQRSGEPGLTNFFQKVREVEIQYENLHSLRRKLQHAHEQSKTATTTRDFKAIKQQMENSVDEVGRVALYAKSKIEELERDNIGNRQKAGCEQGSAVDRTRTTSTLALRRKLKDSMTKFQTLREKIQREYREDVERRVFTVTGTRADEETIDNLIETGESEQIFQKAIREPGQGLVIDTLADIQERHDAVRDLEKKLLDLHKIFVDMAVVVEAQGEMLDNIEVQMEKAKDHVQSGIKALTTAKSKQKSSRKWMCIATLILLLIVAGVLLSVQKSFQSKNGA